MQENHEAWKKFGRKLLGADFDERARMYAEEKHRITTMLRVLSLCKQGGCCKELWDAFISLEHEPAQTFVETLISLPPRKRMQRPQASVAHAFRHIASCGKLGLEDSCEKLLRSLRSSHDLDDHIKTLLAHALSIADSEAYLQSVQETQERLRLEHNLN